MSGLDIPAAAVRAVKGTPYMERYPAAAAEAVCAAAAPAIVAAELLTLAARIDLWTPGPGSINPDLYTKAAIRDLLIERAEEVDPAGIAARLRAEAYDLYRRSDNVPLGLGAHALGQMERFAQLRDRADGLMRRADRLDPRGAL